MNGWAWTSPGNQESHVFLILFSCREILTKNKLSFVGIELFWALQNYRLFEPSLYGRWTAATSWHLFIRTTTSTTPRTYIWNIRGTTTKRTCRCCIRGTPETWHIFITVLGLMNELDACCCLCLLVMLVFIIVINHGTLSVSPHLPNMQASIQMNGFRLIGHIESMLQYHINGYHLRSYMQDRFRWTDRSWSLINHKLFSQHFWTLEFHHQHPAYGICLWSATTFRRPSSTMNHTGNRWERRSVPMLLCSTRTSGKPDLWYGHKSWWFTIEIFCLHLFFYVFSIVCKSFLVLMLFHNMPTWCLLYSLQRFCSTSLYSLSAYVLNHRRYAMESSVILCSFLSIVQIFCLTKNALNCCLFIRCINITQLIYLVGSTSVSQPTAYFWNPNFTMHDARCGCFQTHN